MTNWASAELKEREELSGEELSGELLLALKLLYIQWFMDIFMKIFRLSLPHDM